MSRAADARDRYYSSVRQVRESSDPGEVNRLLQEGWEVLAVRDSTTPVFVLGKVP